MIMGLTIPNNYEGKQICANIQIEEIIMKAGNVPAHIETDVIDFYEIMKI